MRTTSTGIRELRRDLAAHVRRAAAGETIAVSVSGRDVAVLAPPHARSDASLEALVATGALVAPRRRDGRAAAGTVNPLRAVRVDRLLAEVRG